MNEKQRKKLWIRILKRPCFGLWNCLMEVTPGSVEQWNTCTLKVECCKQNVEDMECKTKKCGTRFSR